MKSAVDLTPIVVRLTPTGELWHAPRTAAPIMVPEAVRPMPEEHIRKHYGGWESLEQIVRWVEAYHGIKE